MRKKSKNPAHRDGMKAPAAVFILSSLAAFDAASGFSIGGPNSRHVGCTAACSATSCPMGRLS